MTTTGGLELAGGSSARPRRRFALVCVSVAALVTLAGASLLLAFPGRVGPSPLVLAAEVTAGAGSWRMAMSGTYSGFQDPEEQRMTAEGLYDVGRRRGQLVMDAGDDDVRNTVVFDGDFVYTSMGGVRDTTSGTAWLKQPVADASPIPLPFYTAGLSDMGGAFGFLRAGADDVRQIGKETVRGEPTTRYGFTVDVARLGLAGGMADIMEVDPMPTDAWIGHDGMLRRLDVSLTVRMKPGHEPEEGSDSGAARLSMEFFDFGVRVDVEPPPAEDVVNVDALRSGFEDTEEPSAEGGAVVARGEADGGHWELRVVPTDDGLCLAITGSVAEANGCGDRFSAGEHVGLWWTGYGSRQFVYGPVTLDVARVRVELADGTTVETTPVSRGGLPGLGFYALHLPHEATPRAVVAVDGTGSVLQRIPFES